MAEGDEEIATNLGAAAVTEVTERWESVGGGRLTTSHPSHPLKQQRIDSDAEM